MTSVDIGVRELSIEEIDEIAGGPVPLIAVYLGGLAVGAAIVGGAYLLAKLT